LYQMIVVLGKERDNFPCLNLLNGRQQKCRYRTLSKLETLF